MRPSILARPGQKLFEPQLNAALDYLEARRDGLPMKPATGEYIANIRDGLLVTLTATANQQEIAPFVPGHTFSIDQMGLCVSTLNAGSAACLIFDADENGRPTTFLAKSGDVDTGTTGTKFGAVDFEFEAGKLYWIGQWVSAAPEIRRGGSDSHWALTWTTADPPVRQSALRRTLAWGETVTDWVYDASQHVSVAAPFVLMRMA